MPEHAKELSTLNLVIQEWNIWKSKTEKLAEALELLCFSVAGTEGTATHSSLPVWYQARLKDAKAALNEFREGK